MMNCEPRFTPRIFHVVLFGADVEFEKGDVLLAQGGDVVLVGNGEV